MKTKKQDLETKTIYLYYSQNIFCRKLLVHLSKLRFIYLYTDIPDITSKATACGVTFLQAVRLSLNNEEEKESL